METRLNDLSNQKQSDTVQLRDGHPPQHLSYSVLRDLSYKRTR